MTRRRRALAVAGRLVVGVTVGALAAGAYALGADVGTDGLVTPSASPAVAQAGPLRLDAYCQHLFGGRAAAYQPHRLEEWRCSAWRNGVWGLEDVDLNNACAWQAGHDSRLTSTGTPGGSAPPRLSCGA